MSSLAATSLSLGWAAGAQLSKREAHIAEIQSVSHPVETTLRVLRVVATVHLEGYNQG